MINIRKGGEERALVLNIESQVKSGNNIPHYVNIMSLLFSFLLLIVINTNVLNISFVKCSPGCH